MIIYKKTGPKPLECPDPSGARKMHEGGMTTAQIADHFGVSPPIAVRWVRQAGSCADHRGKHGGNTVPGRREAIIQERAEGRAISEIARRHGITRGLVHYYLNGQKAGR